MANLAKILGVDVSLASTAAALHEVGLSVWVDGIEYTYVQADDAVTALQFVKIDVAIGGSGTATLLPFVVTPTTDPSQTIFAFAPVAITAGYYAWVITEGKCASAKVITGVTAGHLLAPHATDGALNTLAPAATYSQVDITQIHAIATGRGVEALTTSTATAADCYIH